MRVICPRHTPTWRMYIFHVHVCVILKRDSPQCLKYCMSVHGPSDPGVGCGQALSWSGALNGRERWQMAVCHPSSLTHKHTCTSEKSFVRPLSRAWHRGVGRSWGCEGNLKREDVTLRLPNSLGSHLCSLAPAAPSILIVIMSAECPWLIQSAQDFCLIDLANISARLSLIYTKIQIYMYSVILG